MSYSAIVARITVRPHPNADKLLLGLCLGNQVVVGLDHKDGDLGIFFPTDGQLSHEFCVANDLYNQSARNDLKLPGDRPLGYFDTNRRVRAQRFRGEKSDGIWLPLECLYWCEGAAGVREGDQVTELGGYQICQKYYNPRTLRMLKGQVTQASRKVSKFFPLHIDTTQFRFVADTIPFDGVYYITEKLHGTSGRFGFVPTEDKLPKWKSFLNTYLLKRGYFKPTSSYQYLNGSRRVQINPEDGGWYGTNEFRINAVKDLTLHKGEVLYFELVGWVSPETKIMPSHSTEKLQDKAFVKRYGKEIDYLYGCPPGTCKLYLYKISQVNDEGISTELSWSQMNIRARELGIPMVPLLSGPLTADSLTRKWSTDNFNEALRWEVENLTLGPSTLDDRQIKEGVVLRIESPTLGTTHVKNKAFEFGVMEGFWKQNDTGVDLEEVS